MNLSKLNPAQASRRRISLSLIGAFGSTLGAAALVLPTPARAFSSGDISGVWRIDGNGFLGDMILVQQPGGEISGTMYGSDDVRGYFVPSSGLVVLMRGPVARPSQAFIGTVSSNGVHLSGSFYALSTGAGATATRHVFGFRAVRPSWPDPVSYPPALGPVSVPSLASNHTVYNRPSEFPAWTLPLRFNHPAGSTFISGDITGSFAGDAVYGHYAPGSGSLVMLRPTAGQAGQLFLANVALGWWGSQVMAGWFYALTPGMGASPERMRYDWRAQT